MIILHPFDRDRYRGGHPENYGELKQLRDAAKLKTVLALNHPDPNEHAEWCRSLSLQFWNIEMCPVFPPSAESLHLAVRLLLPMPAFDQGPIYVHCHSGVDRTGMVVAAYQINALGWDYERAKENMFQSGMHLWLRWWAPRLKEISRG